MSHIIDGRKISDILSKGESSPLESEYDMEDLISYIHKNRNEIEWYEKLKKERSASIDAEILKKKEQNLVLEKVIISTLEKINKKSLNFPGTGKVTKISRKCKWVIDDQGELLDSLKDKDQAAYDQVVSQKVTDVIDKNTLNQILEQKDKIGDLPSGITKEEIPDSLKLSFDSDEELEVDMPPVGSRTDASSDKKYDGLSLNSKDNMEI